MTVTIGAVVEVLQKSENGWWLVRYSVFCYRFLQAMRVAATQIFLCDCQKARNTGWVAWTLVRNDEQLIKEKTGSVSVTALSTNQQRQLK